MINQVIPEVEKDVVILSFCNHYTPAVQKLACPGPTSIPCGSGTTSPLLWDGTLFMDECPSATPVANSIILPFGLTTQNINDTFVCGQYTAVLMGVTTGPLGVIVYSSSLSFIYC